MDKPSAVNGLAEIYLNARHRGEQLQGIAAAFEPQDEAQAYAVQDAVARILTTEFGPVRGWKVGAATPEAMPFCAPIHEATILEDGATVDTRLCRHFGVEAELAYRFARDLPRGDKPYDENTVLEAIGSIHAAIEIFDTRFDKPNSQSRLAHMADQGNHGAMIIGEGVADWRRFIPSTAAKMTLTINGAVTHHKIGGNSAGDTRRLLTWLANHAAERGLPIKAGDTVISGSTMGTTFVHQDSEVVVEFEGLPPVHATVQVAPV